MSARRIAQHGGYSVSRKTLHLIGAEVGEGASDSGCKWGAAALRERGVMQALGKTGRTVTWGGSVTAMPWQAADRLGVIEAFSAALAVQVEQAMGQGHQPLVIGGDHSCAVGTWSACAQHLRTRGRLGLIWIDAHLDAHTPATSDTQAPHGMPLAALLGHGSEGMAGVYGWRGKLLAQHVVVIGARSYEPPEVALLSRLGVRVMYMPEVAERGFAACFDEARAIVSNGTAGWGVSLDLDGLDPLDLPGTGTPVAHGIRLVDAQAVLAAIGGDPGCVALELAEYNPLRDLGGRTADAAIGLLCEVLGQPQRDMALAA